MISFKEYLEEISKKTLHSYIDKSSYTLDKDREKGVRLAKNKIRAGNKLPKKFGDQLYLKVVDRNASAKDRAEVSTKFKPKIPASK